MIFHCLRRRRRTQLEHYAGPASRFAISGSAGVTPRLGGLAENGRAQFFGIALAVIGQIEQLLDDIVVGNIESPRVGLVDDALQQPVQVFKLVRAIWA